MLVEKFWDALWFLLSLFGRVGLWEHVTSVGGWINGRYNRFWVRSLIVRTKRVDWGRGWEILLPEKRVPLCVYSNISSFGFQVGNTLTSDQKRKFKVERAVKGDVLLFYFGGVEEMFGNRIVRQTTAAIMVFTGRRWKTLVVPSNVSSFHLKDNRDECYGGGYVQFRNGATFEWKCSTRAGISDHILLDFLGGRMSYGEFLATYALGLQEKQMYVSEGLQIALDSLEKTRDAFKSPHVARAETSIRLALRHTHN